MQSIRSIVEHSVFPTHVGVNRSLSHERKMAIDVFPTHVVVNRVVLVKQLSLMRFPHTRGGEPIRRFYLCASITKFSPHTWG